MSELITADFLISKGFSKPERWFDNRWNQFRVFYKIKGYDCDILISPSPQVVGDMTPEEQVEDFSDLKLLESHHIGDWHIYVNSFKNHLVTIHETMELIDFMRVCKCNIL